MKGINVHGQLCSHETVIIEGTKDGMLHLLNHLAQALLGIDEAPVFFDSAREGYRIVFRELTEADFADADAPKSIWDEREVGK